MRDPSTVYRGERLVGPTGKPLGIKVTVGGKILSPRPSQDVHNHSASGFEWGYCGSGPAQLALALVLDATGDRNLALASYQWFKQAVVSQWGDRWEITAGEVVRWTERWRREAGGDEPNCLRCAVVAEGGAA